MLVLIEVVFAALKLGLLIDQGDFVLELLLRDGTLLDEQQAHLADDFVFCFSNQRAAHFRIRIVLLVYSDGTVEQLLCN